MRTQTEKRSKTLAKTVFNQKGIPFGEWCMVNTCHKNPADEIGIFILCKLSLDTVLFTITKVSGQLLSIKTVRVAVK